MLHQLTVDLRRQDPKRKFSRASPTRKREVKHKTTGTCFDRTVRSIQSAGTHRPAGPGGIDSSAFRLRPRIVPPSPDAYLRRHTGFGGDNTMRSLRRVQTSHAAMRRARTPPNAGAQRPRDNPPNTSFRVFYERGDLPVQICHSAVHNRLQVRSPARTRALANSLTTCSGLAPSAVEGRDLQAGSTALPPHLL